MHEHPYLNSGNRQPLKEGETFSVEPGVYIEQAVDKDGGGIGVRLEDMVRLVPFGRPSSFLTSSCSRRLTRRLKAGSC